MGVYHSCGINNNGTVLCWGNNEYGEISNTTEAVGYANDTSSSLREKLLNKLKLALVPFLEKANYNLTIDVDSNIKDLTVYDEKWRNWVFELSGSYNNDKEESRQTNRYDVEFEIDFCVEIGLYFEFDFDVGFGFGFDVEC